MIWRVFPSVSSRLLTLTCRTLVEICMVGRVAYPVLAVPAPVWRGDRPWASRHGCSHRNDDGVDFLGPPRRQAA